MEKKSEFLVKATGQRVIVEVISTKQQKTKAGIIIPESTMANTQKAMPRGKVVSIGPKCDISHFDDKEGHVTLKLGDTVIYAATSGYPLIYDGKDHDILYEIDILAVDQRN